MNDIIPPMEDLRIKKKCPSLSPGELKRQFPLTPETAKVVLQGRQEIDAIFNGNDRRMVWVIGPCSFHNVQEVIDYAKGLVEIREKVKDRILIIIRLCPYKPRSDRDWRGMGLDPYMDYTWDINEGLRRTRQAALGILSLGFPIAMEMLAEDTQQHIADLFSYVWVGARDVYSDTKKAIASGSSMRVGFKNDTHGGVSAAVAACSVARHENAFPGRDDANNPMIIHTLGNPETNIILRGGNSGPNYGEENVRLVIAMLKNRDLCQNIMIDCNHGNSGKDHMRQVAVAKEVVAQRLTNPHVVGILFESYINEGNQKIPADMRDIEPGISVTDKCTSLPDTINLLLFASKELGKA